MKLPLGFVDCVIVLFWAVLLLMAPQEPYLGFHSVYIQVLTGAMLFRHC